MPSAVIVRENDDVMNDDVGRKNVNVASSLGSAPTTAPSSPNRVTQTRPGKKVLSAAHLKKMSDGRMGARSTQSRCETTFPVAILRRRLLKDKYAARVSTSASVWLSGALETLMLEVLDSVVAQTERSRKKCVTSQHVMAALKSDDEFQRIFKNVIIARGGVGGVSSEHRSVAGPSKATSASKPKPKVSSNNEMADDEGEEEDDDDDGDELASAAAASPNGNEDDEEEVEQEDEEQEDDGDGDSQEY